MATIRDIERLTKEYSDGRESLAERVRSLEDEMEAQKRQRLPVIKGAAKVVMERLARLRDAIAESRDLFIKPKTMILHGVKVGFQKGKGKISWMDDEQVVKLIKKHFPEQADVLIKTAERPVKDALQQLPAADLKRLGITIEEVGDQVVVKSTDSEIDKFVDALLKEDDLKEAKAA